MISSTARPSSSGWNVSIAAVARDGSRRVEVCGQSVPHSIRSGLARISERARTATSA
jgi:hypothetical protein